MFLLKKNPSRFVSAKRDLLEKRLERAAKRFLCAAACVPVFFAFYCITIIFFQGYWNGWLMNFACIASDGVLASAACLFLRMSHIQDLLTLLDFVESIGL